ncbi:11244_t:CDS:2, partial [Funneliformis geosporum]
QQVSLSEAETEDILHYRIDKFTLDRLFTYAERLGINLQISKTKAKTKIGYEAQDLKKHFERVGGSHNLMEDCQTIANSFAKIEDLGKIKDVLKNCHSKQEYDTKKANFIQKCDESINGLRPRTGYSSSMFG